MSDNKDPLFHLGWIEFNRKHWGVRAEFIELGPRSGTSWSLNTILYKNSKGQLVNPPRNPYIPVEFECASDSPSSTMRRKRAAIQALADIYQKSSIKGGINLSPIVDDVRPFLWGGMSATPRYTYYVELGEHEARIDKRALKKSKKALALGYTCELTDDFQGVQECLQESERRKGFSHAVDADGLAILHQLVGSEGFCCIVIRDALGKLAGARVLLYQNGGMVLAWSAGIKSHALRDGANNLLATYAMEYFTKQGCEVFDFVGANIPPVAEMKEAWGGDLVCYYTIRQPNIRNFARDVYLAARSYMKKR